MMKRRTFLQTTAVSLASSSWLLTNCAHFSRLGMSSVSRESQKQIENLVSELSKYQVVHFQELPSAFTVAEQADERTSETTALEDFVDHFMGPLSNPRLAQKPFSQIRAEHLPYEVHNFYW